MSEDNETIDILMKLQVNLTDANILFAQYNNMFPTAEGDSAQRLKEHLIEIYNAKNLLYKFSDDEEMKLNVDIVNSNLVSFSKIISNNFVGDDAEISKYRRDNLLIPALLSNVELSGLLTKDAHEKFDIYHFGKILIPITYKSIDNIIQTKDFTKTNSYNIAKIANTIRVGTLIMPVSDKLNKEGETTNFPHVNVRREFESLGDYISNSLNNVKQHKKHFIVSDIDSIKGFNKDSKEFFENYVEELK